MGLRGEAAPFRGGERVLATKAKPKPTMSWAGRVPLLKPGRYADGLPINEVQYLCCKLMLRPNHFTSRKSLFEFAKVMREPAAEHGVTLSTKEFQDAGISLVAISTDDDAGLAKSIENYKSGVFPFPLVSDPGLEVFKAYRTHDDFENRPLHGTFFIDGAGRVRWQDISFEPFRDARFLLNEARRLLAISEANSSATNQANLSAGIIGDMGSAGAVTTP
jgi:hypothetical protein